MDVWIPTPYVGVLILGGLLLSSTYTVKSLESKRSFPGPTQLPLIGRVHDLPRKATWLKFHEWAGTYGPIFQTSMMGQKFVVVSDEEIARELLLKKADQLSGRAQIRALLNHKEDPTYFALEDRQGKRPAVFDRKASQAADTIVQRHGGCKENGSTQRWWPLTSTISTVTSRTKSNAGS